MRSKVPQKVLRGSPAGPEQHEEEFSDSRNDPSWRQNKNSYYHLKCTVICIITVTLSTVIKTMCTAQKYCESTTNWYISCQIKSMWHLLRWLAFRRTSSELNNANVALFHTHLYRVFKGQSGQGGENMRKRGISAFFLTQLLPTFLQSLLNLICMWGNRGASHGGRPSAVTVLLSQSLLKQAKCITAVSETGFLQYSRGLGHSCLRIKLQ